MENELTVKSRKERLDGSIAQQQHRPVFRLHTPATQFSDVTSFSNLKNSAGKKITNHRRAFDRVYLRCVNEQHVLGRRLLYIRFSA